VGIKTGVLKNRPAFLRGCMELLGLNETMASMIEELGLIIKE
tara:strand:+ start:170 stop:295 length:126 start_codon:yes stop_codon:yes gene_type:complete